MNNDFQPHEHYPKPCMKRHPPWKQVGSHSTPKSCSGVGTSFDFTSILYTLYLSGFLVIVGTTVKVAVIWALGVFLLYVQKTLSTSNSNCMKLLLSIISSFDEIIFSGKILVHPGDWVFPQPDMAMTHQPELAGQQVQGLQGGC